MPRMLLIEPVDLLGQRAQITMTHDQLDVITKAVQAWVGQGNDIINLTLVRDRVNKAWVLMGAEITTVDAMDDEQKKEFEAVVREAQEVYRQELRMQLTEAKEEWYGLRVTESVQVGGVG